MEFRDILKAELNRVERQLSEARERAAILRRTLAKYQRAGTQGHVARGPSAVTQMRTSHKRPTRLRGGGKNRVQRRTKLTSAAPSTKAGKLRAILAAEGSAGVTARDLMSRLGPQAAKAGINSIHAALSKMKAAKLVSVSDGKYFPTAALTKHSPLGAPGSSGV